MTSAMVLLVQSYTSHMLVHFLVAMQRVRSCKAFFSLAGNAHEFRQYLLPVRFDAYCGQLVLPSVAAAATSFFDQQYCDRQS